MWPDPMKLFGMSNVVVLIFFVPKEKPRMDYEPLTYVQMRDFIMSQAHGDTPANP